ncbi:MAG: DUF4133 domain-containing protein [Prevotellaceae bacterium]|jgi:hypothetical protein|nr:DUF4133 domain-containing protein [Prevotellaceae bacterium]
MATFSINKGIGRSAEFQGLKSQYLFMFAGGLLGLFILFVIMYMAGINQWFCIGFGVVSALVLVYGTFYLNKKFGEFGLMKWQARKNFPKFVISRKSFLKILKTKKAVEYEKYNEIGNA